MRILVVEDEHKIADAIKRGLEHEGYSVDVAYNGNDGYAFATVRTSYNLIILDRMLPGPWDGLDICRKVRDAGLRTPILLLTAKDKTRDRVEGLRGGADDYLVKPFAFEELLARVHALLRRSTDRVTPVLAIEDLTLNTSTYAVERSKKAIHLSKKEFILLEYLMRNPNTILTKDAIKSHVWNYDADIMPNTVEVYIGYLRNKIDKPFPGPHLIHTVRGFGYKIGKEY
jgi:DNA-binding response OmpR family regulator